MKCKQQCDKEHHKTWCGAVRCGAERCGAVRSGAVRCGAERCGSERCGAENNAVQRIYRNILRIFLRLCADCPSVVVIEVEFIVDKQSKEYEFSKKKILKIWLNKCKCICINA